MTEPELKQLLTAITPPSETARAAAHAHWASLAKPLGGLGALETLLEDAAALTGSARLAFPRRAVLVLCAPVWLFPTTTAKLRRCPAPSLFTS